MATPEAALTRRPERPWEEISNLAVAVSLRELALGLVRPSELGRVLGKEASLGVVNGLVLGALWAGWRCSGKATRTSGWWWAGRWPPTPWWRCPWGGLLALLLKRLRMDAALVSGPLLTTVTDMCGFFFVLSFATAVLPRLGA